MYSQEFIDSLLDCPVWDKYDEKYGGLDGMIKNLESQKCPNDCHHCGKTLDWRKRLAKSSVGCPGGYWFWFCGEPCMRLSTNTKSHHNLSHSECAKV